MRISVSCALLAIGVMIGCETVPVDRQSRLLTLAAGEAQQIKNSQQRLTRQLNFASLQTGRGQKQEARQSLAFAAQTPRDAKPGDLHPQIRIAGWVSISELSRGIVDRTAAQAACDQAVTVLRTLEPVADRPDYVIGVASEVQALQGKQPAAKLLEESANWVRQMKGVSLQRVALAAICDAIIDDDDYTGGLAVLRTDADATWRSDTLAMLAERDNTEYTDANGNTVAGTANSRRLVWEANVANAAVPGSVAGRPMLRDQSSSITQSAVAPPSSSVGIRGFGKPVDFQSVFAGRTDSADENATTKPMPPLDQR